jgi:hypothetical protein
MMSVAGERVERVQGECQGEHTEMKMDTDKGIDPCFPRILPQ